MQLKDFAQRYIRWPLTIGAVLTISFLSFSGMLALWPVLSLAIGAFGLSALFETEIYHRCVGSALDHVVNKRALKRQLTKEFLAENFPYDSVSNTNSGVLNRKIHEFYQRYQYAVTRVDHLKHKKLDAEAEKLLEAMDNEINTMEDFFSDCLFDEENIAEETRYGTTLKATIAQEQRQNYKKRLNDLNIASRVIGAITSVAGILFGLGTIYELMEFVSAIPFLAALPVTTLPFVIVPLAIFSGLAYAALSYYAMNDMWIHNTINAWIERLQTTYKSGHKWRAIGMTLAATGLTVLMTTLTVFSVGTWYTIVTKTRPLFQWMTRLPFFIMGTLTAITTLVFNIKNGSDTLEMIMDGLEKNETPPTAVKPLKQIPYDKNWKQRWLNPARYLIIIVYRPLHVILFLAHLVGMGVMANRMPNVSVVLTAIWGILCEGATDIHWYYDFFESTDAHDHDFRTLLQERVKAGNDHDHSDDIPTRCLKWLFSPVFAAAAWCDKYFSSDNITTAEWKISWMETLPDNINSGHYTHTFIFAGNILYYIDTNACPQPIYVTDSKLLQTMFLTKTETFVNRANINTFTENFIPPNAVLTDKEILQQQIGESCEKTLCETVCLPSKESGNLSLAPSLAHNTAMILHLIKEEQDALNNAWIEPRLASTKNNLLETLKTDLKKKDPTRSLIQKIKEHQNTPSTVYEQHRFCFPFNSGKTHTQEFLDKLPEYGVVFRAH